MTVVDFSPPPKRGVRGDRDGSPEGANVTPKISVVMPAYNRADLIGEALLSVHRQTHRPIELIVVDDGSTDGTREVAARFKSAREADDFQVKIAYQANAGVGAARNAGIERVTGQYLQFLDSDDVLLPTKLEAQVYALAARPAAAYSWCKTIQVNDRGVISATIGLPMKDADREIAQHHWHISGLLLRANRLRAIGPFSADLPIVEDWEFAARVKAECGVGFFLPQVLAEYRIHAGDQIIKGSLSRFYTARASAIGKVRRLLIDRGRLSQRANRSLDELALRNALGSWASLSKAETLEQVRSVLGRTHGWAGVEGAALFALIWATPHSLARRLTRVGSRASALTKRVARPQRKVVAEL